MAVLFAVLPLTVGWILIALAESVTVLYISRICAGLSLGFGYTVLPIYLGEIASDKIRGSIGTLLAVMMKLGILYAYAIGPYVSITMMAWLALIPPALFAVTFVWLPESPYYLLGKDQRTAARHSLERLRGHKNVEPELDRMDAAVKKSRENRGRFREVLASDNRMIITIILVLGIIQHVCGGHAVIGYAQTIFDKIKSQLRGSEATIVLGTVQLVSAIIGAVLVDLLGRKPLLLFAGAGTAVCSTVVGIYFFLERQHVDVSDIGWIPLLALMVFIVCYNVGITTIPYVILGEICPKHLKAIVAGLYTAVSSVFAFSVGKSFQIVSDSCGSDVAFWIFAGFSYAFIPFVWLCIPETKGKPLDVILSEMNLTHLHVGTSSVEGEVENKKR